MSSLKFADLFFHKKYLDWNVWLPQIPEAESEYYAIVGGEFHICG